MRNALPSSLFAGFVLFAVGGCSSGSSETTSSVRIRCINGESFCIISCDLGCSQAGCSVTEIAENQRLRFRFSDPVARDSVNSGSISIRTATGVTPDGFFEFSESDTLVTFVPRVSTVGGISTFGFLRNESYILTLSGGANGAFGVRSLSGATLKNDFSCTVVASRGITDEDQQPPRASLLSPTAGSNTAPRNPTIVLRFSELIDTTALRSPLSVASPVRVVLRGTRPDGSCDRDADGVALEGLAQLSTETVGSREVTVVTYQPPVQLPGLSCVTVYVTAELRDLSGRPAIPDQFEFTTVVGTPSPFTVVEPFANAQHQEALVSGGIWSNGARSGLLGGDGRHGSFKPQFGNALGGNVFEWNTDNFTIPGSNTPNGQPAVVTDGQFFFTDMILPVGTTLRFVGATVPKFFVRGQVEIRGTIQVNGVDLPFGIPTAGLAAGQRVSTFNARSSLSNVRAGQPGSAGGPGGAAGGKGGDKSTGGTIPTPDTAGSPGQNVRPPLGHFSIGQQVGTGGAGGPMMPAAGTNAAAGAPVLASLYRGQYSRGGNGGSFLLPGGLPSAPTTPVGLLTSTAPTPGLTFPLLPFPSTPPPGYSSMDHFLVGGSGGGGGGSHTFLLLAIGATTDFYMAGSGGSGGGGTFAIRSGSDMLIASTGLLQATGGAGVLICGDDPATPTQESLTQPACFGISSPGGGGSGGSFLMQSGRTLAMLGAVDTRGGAGSRIGLMSPVSGNAVAQAGAGATGFYRLEAPVPVSGQGLAGSMFPSFVPADNTAILQDRDPVSGDQSTWYPTGQIFPPSWQRYELDVDQDGDGNIDITYTDSGAAGTVRANDPAGPVTIQFQGATLNQAGTAPLPGSPAKPWRDGIGSGAGPGISQDSVTGFRFQLLWNRGAFPSAVIVQLRVFGQS